MISSVAPNRLSTFYAYIITKIGNRNLKCKMLRFFSLSFWEAAHAYSFHTKNFAILTKISNSSAEKLLMCKILRPYNSWLSHNGKNTDFCMLMSGPCHVGLEDGDLNKSIGSV